MYVFRGYKRPPLRYTLSAAAVPPVTAMRLLALSDNGISAAEHRFLRLLCKACGSAAINNITGEACFGGERTRTGLGPQAADGCIRAIRDKYERIVATGVKAGRSESEKY